MDDQAGSADVDAGQHRCEQCGADAGFDPASQRLLCGHCGHSMPVPEQADKSVVEYDLESGLAMARRGFGGEATARTTQCGECGARVTFGESVTATACEFCGSAQVMEQQHNRNLLSPESLVPFHVDKAVAQDKFNGWVRGLWFRPSALKHKARVAEMNGVYVPYWTFDARVDSEWSADSGYYYYETESYTDKDDKGNTVTRNRQVRRTRWQRSRGSRRDIYDDVLVCASAGLPAELAQKLESFDTSQLRPYEPGYLAGWKAEEYALELNDGWHKAVSSMESSQHSRCGSDVPGDTYRFLRVSNRFHDETFKHVLLPIWISSYRYEDNVYRFLVNGQTGEVTGNAPLSILKIVLFVAVMIAIVVAIVLATQK